MAIDEIATAIEEEQVQAVDKDDDKFRPDARHYVILNELAKSPNGLKAEDLLKSTNPYRRRCKGTDSTVRSDIKDIRELLEGKTIACTEEHELQLRPESSFESLGYGRCDPSSEKARIGKFIVEEYLKNPQEVVYLSTGTNVYEVARALVESIERGLKKTVRVILTDNLAIVDMFNKRAPFNATLWQQLQFVILGGVADFAQGDIALESTFSQLAQCHCSTAVVSATNMNPRTGTVCTFRQPETKKQFFQDADVGQIIIPLEPKKISKICGGWLIHDPLKAADDHREYHIVTTKLDPGIAGKLRELKYIVREIDSPDIHYNYVS